MKTLMRILRTERRLWLLQVAFWPALVLTTLGVSVALRRRVMNRSGNTKIFTKSIAALVQAGCG